MRKQICTDSRVSDVYDNFRRQSQRNFRQHYTRAHTHTHTYNIHGLASSRRQKHRWQIAVANAVVLGLAFHRERVGTVGAGSGAGYSGRRKLIGAQIQIEVAVTASFPTITEGHLRMGGVAARPRARSKREKSFTEQAVVYVAIIATAGCCVRRHGRSRRPNPTIQRPSGRRDASSRRRLQDADVVSNYNAMFMRLRS